MSVESTFLERMEVDFAANKPGEPFINFEGRMSPSLCRIPIPDDFFPDVRVEGRDFYVETKTNLNGRPLNISYCFLLTGDPAEDGRHVRHLFRSVWHVTELARLNQTEELKAMGWET